MIPGSGRFAGGGIDYPLQYSWASLVAQLVKNLPIMRETWTRPWVENISWRRERLPIPVFWPGQFHGLYSSWGRKESDTTEGLSLCIPKGIPSVLTGVQSSKSCYFTYHLSHSLILSTSPFFNYMVDSHKMAR